MALRHDASPAPSFSPAPSPPQGAAAMGACNSGDADSPLFSGTVAEPSLEWRSDACFTTGARNPTDYDQQSPPISSRRVPASCRTLPCGMIDPVGLLFDDLARVADAEAVE